MTKQIYCVDDKINIFSTKKILEELLVDKTLEIKNIKNEEIIYNLEQNSIVIDQIYDLNKMIYKKICYQNYIIINKNIIKSYIKLKKNLDICNFITYTYLIFKNKLFIFLIKKTYEYYQQKYNLSDYQYMKFLISKSKIRKSLLIKQITSIIKDYRKQIITSLPSEENKIEILLICHPKIQYQVKKEIYDPSIKYIFVDEFIEKYEPRNHYKIIKYYINRGIDGIIYIKSKNDIQETNNLSKINKIIEENNLPFLNINIQQTSTNTNNELLKIQNYIVSIKIKKKKYF